MSGAADARRCAIYTRKSSEEGLEQAFNLLHAQREACEAYVKSQVHEGWVDLPALYDDGGFSGGTTERPGLKQLLADIRSGLIDIVLVYKVDRLSRSLADFVRLVELFDLHQVSFVSVTQQFNTSTSMGRLTLNVLLSFAQFEREVTGERIRDKISASKQKGMWMGGLVPLGYDRVDKQLVANDEEAVLIRHIYEQYLRLGCVRTLKHELDAAGHRTKKRAPESRLPGGTLFSRGALYTILKNPVYIGKVHHQGELYEGCHDAIVNLKQWERVQAKLAGNRKANAAKANAKYPSLLKGLVVDDQGNRMSPTYTRKGNRHYGYYVSQALLQYRDGEAGSVVRLPAAALENIVVDKLLELLEDQHQLLDVLGVGEMPAIDQKKILEGASRLVGRWPLLSAQDRIEVLQSWFDHIIVGKAAVVLKVNDRRALSALGGDINAPEASVQRTIRIPVELKRSGIETKLVLSGGPEPSVHSRSVKALQVAVLNAMRWNHELLSGAVSSIKEIAEREDHDDRYIGRIRKLAFLAPEVIEAIAEGKVSENLTLDVLRLGYPQDWAVQRRQFLGADHRL